MEEHGLTGENITQKQSATVLKQYFERYLSEVRGLSVSSVGHYRNALNVVSKKLRELGVVKTDVYEIRDLDALMQAREVLFHDEAFVRQNEVGRRMYSAGFNNYIRFAQGDDFKKADTVVVRLDIPMEAQPPQIVEQVVWKRSEILRTQALAYADYQCEMDQEHETFIAEENQKPYMEGHHAIPMRLQPQFDHSLDVYANIVCLCPICHRRIHYGRKEERVQMMNQIYHGRGERLANSGIFLSQDEFARLAL